MDGTLRNNAKEAPSPQGRVGWAGWMDGGVKRNVDRPFSRLLPLLPSFSYPSSHGHAALPVCLVHIREAVASQASMRLMMSCIDGLNGFGGFLEQSSALVNAALTL